jgi:hypothetical protein
MRSQEPFGQLARVAAIGLLLAVLFGLMVWSGASPVDPMESEPPNEVEVTPDREAYVGDRVVLGGQVVDTDPVVIATQASGYGRFTVVDADDHAQNANELEAGDDVSAYGTLEDESTLVAERVTVQNPSETRYMVLVSLLGGLWVAGRVVRDWQFDLDRLAFVPRERAASAGDGDDRERSGLDSAVGEEAVGTRADSSQDRRESASTGGERRG